MAEKFAAAKVSKEKVTAPYNFVSLPKKILPSEIVIVDEFKNHVETLGKISGEIGLKI